MIWILVITLIASAPDSAQGQARTRIEPYTSQAACETAKAAVTEQLRDSVKRSVAVAIGCVGVKIPATV